MVVSIWLFIISDNKKRFKSNNSRKKWSWKNYFNKYKELETTYFSEDALVKIMKAVYEESLEDFKVEEHYKYSLINSTKQLDHDDSIIKMTNVYTSDKLSNIAFVVLEQFVKKSNKLSFICQGLL